MPIPSVLNPSDLKSNRLKNQNEEAFSVAKHLGGGWSVADNPSNMFVGHIDANPNSAHIFSVGYTKDGEQRQSEILKARKMLLNRDSFLYFWLNKENIPKKWKYGYVTFDGTTYLNAKGDRFVLCLRYDPEGFWTYKFKSLSEKISTNYAFAAL